MTEEMNQNINQFCEEMIFLDYMKISVKKTLYI